MASAPRLHRRAGGNGRVVPEQRRMVRPRAQRRVSGLLREPVRHAAGGSRREMSAAKSATATGGGIELRGVVLAGGTGSRLFPLTKVTNKHLLPVYDRPMIYYPIQTLVDAGIQEILIVTGGRNSGDFLRLLANGKQFG